MWEGRETGMSQHGPPNSETEGKLSVVELTNELAMRKLELTEALNGQAATSEILRAISRSPTDLQPVFDIIAENAVRLCGAEVGTVFRYDGTLLHLKAIYGSNAAAMDAVRQAFPSAPGDATSAARAVRDCATVQIPDNQSDKRYGIKVTALAAGFRSLLAVPMIHDGRAIGAITVGRAEPGRFSDRQEQILATFAEQAIIAIENVRLFEEVQVRTRELEQLSNHLAKYLSPQLYDSIFSGKQEARLVSKRKRLTVFFSDIEGFTETTERLESEDVTSLLNQYLTEMSQIALAHGATIDKYVGDAIVIFFGDPETRGVKEDALACVTMAIAMRKRMKQLENVWMGSGIEKPLRCRIGINTGVCTVGNFGSDDRMDYTIIGGGVNLASRLQVACPVSEILISYETYAHVKDVIECEEVGQVEVKGVSYPVSTYRVIDLYENLGEEKRPIRAKMPHVRLDVDVNLMTAKEKRQAATLLQEAVDRLSKIDPKA
jgi:class 3 adenylate cyclase